MKSFIPILAASAFAVAACSDNTSADRNMVEGPVVSGSETPRNAAIDTQTGNTLTPGANSFTEGQARAAIEKQGYTDIGPLTQDNQGIWSATATKSGQQSTVAVDYKGAVSVR